MNNYTEWARADLAAKLQELELQLTAPRSLAVCGGCACGIAYVPEFDSLDSGTTLTDEAGHKHVVSIASPEEYAKVYADIAAAHTELAQLKIKAGLALRLLDLLERQQDAEVGVHRFGHSGEHYISVRRPFGINIYKTRDTFLEALEAALDAMWEDET